MITSALTFALAGLRFHRDRVDRAARAIASAGLDSPDTTSGEGESPSAPATDPAMDLTDAMTTMLIAQRAYLAQLRVIETADEMAREAVSLGKRTGES